VLFRSSYRAQFPLAQFLIAQIYAMEQKWDKARERLDMFEKNKWKLTKNESTYWAWRAFVLHNLKRDSDARTALGKAVEYDEPLAASLWAARMLQQMNL
jgi:hypothetical protein